MKKIILSLMLVTSLSFGISAFKPEDDRKTHIALGVMSGVWGNLLAKKLGANDTQAFFIGIGASVLGGAIVSGGNMDSVSDAMGGVIGSGAIVIYRFN